MAGKEATVYIVDLGASTADCRSGRIESDLDFGMRYIWEKIALTLGMNRKSDLVGVIGFRTDKTAHQLDQEEYPNISILKPCESMSMRHLKELQKLIKPSDTDNGDAISAIVVAIEHIQGATLLKDGKSLAKYKRTIVLLTDGQGHMDPDGLDDSGMPASVEPSDLVFWGLEEGKLILRLPTVASQIKEVGIELKVVGIDFDDREYGFKEENKAKVKQTNENTLKLLVELCDGTYGTAAMAIEYASTPQIKPARPYDCFRGKLSLGDYRLYAETALYIDVVRYFKTKQKKPDSASTVVSRAVNSVSGQSSHTIEGDVEMGDAPSLSRDLAAVKNDRIYTVKAEEGDERAENGKLTVDREALATGYAYGSSAVAISESEQNIVKLETFAEFTILGFVTWDKDERYLNMGESCITVAESTNDKARMALSSLVHSLHELESYAVARLCRPLRKGSEEGKDPEIILLAPLIENDIEALIDVPLPFAEDVRLYRFPPLDRVITTSGAVVTTHRNIPNDDLVQAMSDYVDCMDLSMFGKDEDGKPAEYMLIEETSSPVVHRINQAVRRRATHPEETLVGEPAAILTKYSEPPLDLVEKAAPALEILRKAANIKEVPPKVKSKSKAKGNPVKPLSDLNIGDLLNSRRRQKISPDNSIAEFIQMLDGADGNDNKGTLKDAAKQMSDIIRALIRKQVQGPAAGSIQGQALANIKVMRERLDMYDEPDLFNDFIKPLKKDLLNGNLTDKKTSKGIWFEIRKANLGLLDNESSSKTATTSDDASDFWATSEVDLPSRSR